MSRIAYQKKGMSMYSKLIMPLLVAVLSYSGAREFSGMSAILAYSVCGVAIGLAITVAVAKLRGRNGC